MGIKNLDLKDKHSSIVIGDMHFSDVFQGRHKNYAKVCQNAMQRILERVRDGQYEVVFFTGDFTGVKHDKYFSTLEFRLSIDLFLQQLSNIATVICLSGNHVDMLGNLTELQRFQTMGWLSVVETDDPNYIDVGNTRFHLIDYGNEASTLTYGKNTNVILMHNLFKVRNETDWFYTADIGVELCTMVHWDMADVIIGGHLHIASPKWVTTYIGTRKVDLIYAGSPTLPEFVEERPKYCHGITFIDSDTDVQMGIVPIEVEQDVYDLEKQVTKRNRQAANINEQLVAVVEDMQKFKYVKGDWRTQLKVITHDRPEVYDLISTYIGKVERGDGKKRKAKI